MKPSRRSLYGWLAWTLALCTTQASADDLAFRDNFETHVYYGWPVRFTRSTSIAARQVLAYKVTIPSVTTLDRFGLVVDSGTSDFTQALYTDAGGVPGTLEYSTTPASLLAGVNETYVPYATLAAGDYWIAVRFTENTAIGYGSPAQTGMQCIRNFDIASIDDPWPTSFGSSTCATESLMNLYLITFNP